jgi:hypothetical protein
MSRGLDLKGNGTGNLMLNSLDSKNDDMELVFADDEDSENGKPNKKTKEENKAKREAKEKAKRPILWGLLICAVVANLSYLNAVALLPLYIKEYYKEIINDTWIGVLLACY